MSSPITSLNSFSAPLIAIVESIVWQSTALILILFLLDLALRSRVPAVLRYGLWLLVLVKLLLPPVLALPTGLAYWLPETKPAVPASSQMASVSVFQSGNAAIARDLSGGIPEPAPKLSAQSWLFLIWLLGVLGLSAWLAHRSRVAFRLERESEDPPTDLARLLEASRDQMGIKKFVRLKVFSGTGGPVVFGIFHPVILIPSGLKEQLTSAQMRSVLLHELAHVQRGDVWANCAQSVLQIVYWFHPLLWLTNAQIRRVREQAVDERVMIEMKEQPGVYPAALLKVARLSWSKPILMPGLLGILESKAALKQRIKRLIERPVPRSAKLDLAGFISILIIALALLPMTRAQRNDSAAPNPPVKAGQLPTPESELIETPEDPNLLKEDRQRRGDELREAEAKKAISEVEERWKSQYPNMLEKLSRIRAPKSTFDHVPLEKVLKKLHNESIDLDPERIGVEFGFSPEISEAKISVIPPVGDLRPLEILSLIAKGADQPINFMVYSHSVFFYGGSALFTRIFRVNPTLLARNIEPSSSVTSTTNRSLFALQNLLALFRAGGITIEPPKSLYYADRRGDLMIRATLDDLNRIGTLLSPLQTDVSEVLIEARFIAANQSQADAQLERISAGGKPSLSAQGVTVNFVSRLEDGPGYSVSVNAIGYIQHKSEARISMLDFVQKTNWLQAAEKTSGWEVLSAPRVSTATGRPAKITITNAEKIDGKEHSFGPTLDVLPTVRNGIIDLEVTATIVEKDTVLTYKPKIRTSEIKGKFSISKRGAVILSGPEFKAPDGRGYYIVISARQIDSAGNPVDP